MTDALIIIAILICLLIIETIAIVIQHQDHKSRRAYDSETIRSLREQLDQAVKNDHRDAKGRYVEWTVGPGGARGGAGGSR